MYTILVRKLKSFLFYLAGTWPRIIERLPEKDKAPYLLIGIYQLFVLVISTASFLWLIISNFRYISVGYLCVDFILYIVIATGALRANRRLVNNTQHVPYRFYLFIALVVSGATALVIYLNIAVKEALSDVGIYFFNSSVVQQFYYLVWRQRSIPGIFLAFMGFTVLITLLSIIYSKLRQLHHDFYHTLLLEIEKQETEGLQAERQRIQEEFRIQSEIINRQVAINEMQGKAAGRAEVTATQNASTAPLTAELVFDRAGEFFRLGDIPKALEYINKAIELDDSHQAKDPDYFLHPEYYELKGKILQASDSEGSKAALDRAIELDSENKYRINLTKEIILNRIKVQQLPFFGSFEWRLTPGINILLGKNGYGKTHLLRLIVALLYGDKVKIRDWIPTKASLNTIANVYVDSDHPVREDVIQELNEQLDELYEQKTKIAGSKEEQLIDQQINNLSDQLDSEQRRIMAVKNIITGKIGRVPVLAIPDSRFISRSTNTITNEKTESEDLRKDGATDFLYGKSLEPIINKSLFIVAQNNRTDFFKEPYLLIQRVISELAEPGSLKSISTDDPDKRAGFIKFSKPFFQFSRIETVSATGDYKFYVRSEENQEEVPLQNISQGTLSILSICLLIYRFLKELRPQSDNPLKEKAIVLIDEIDAHLHPSWEQKIIGLLRREFPHVQFIITAHSPLIVAGCLEKEVNIIRHTNDGFYLEQPTKNFIGYSTPELFKMIFEIEDRDNQYLYYAALSSREPEFQSRLGLLKEKKEEGELTTAQQQELDELQKDLNYIKVVNRMLQKEAAVSTSRTLDKTWKQEAEYWKQEFEILKRKLSLNN